MHALPLRKRTGMCRRWALLLVAAVFLVPSVAKLQAQPPAAPATPPVPATNPAVKPATPATTPLPVAPDAIKEQTVYIPYTKLREVFEKEGRGVFLPYDKFQALWKAAHENRAKPAEHRPPTGALVTEASHDAVVQGDVVRVTARVKYELLGEGWQRVPLRLDDAAILSAKIGNEPARLVRDPQLGYVLLMKAEPGKDAKGELVIEFAKNYDKTPGKNRVSFRAPLAPASRWQITVPDPGVKIDVRPLLAASELTDNAKQSRVQAFVGAADEVAIEWTPRADGAQGLETLAHVQIDEQVAVEEAMTRTRATVALTVLRGELSKIEFDVPADQRVVNVFDTNVKRWTTTKPAGGATAQRVSVELFEPARSSQTIQVELEKLVGEGAADPRGVPFLNVQNVGRQQGFVTVEATDGLQLDVDRRSGLVQVDREELPAALKARSWRLAYRYSSPSVELALKVAKIQPRVTVDSLIESVVEPERLTTHVQARYTIDQAGIFRLVWTLPAGVEVRQVRGHTDAGYTPFVVSAFRTEGENNNRLVVDLGRQAIGKAALYIEVIQKLGQPELLAPTEKPLTMAMPVLHPEGTEVQRADGRLVVYTVPQLRLQVDAVDGLRNVALDEARASFKPLVSADRPTVQAFAWSQPQVKLSIVAQRRKPYIAVRQLLRLRVESGAVQGNVAFHFDLLYSGVKTLRVDVPKNLSGMLRNDTPGVSDTILAPPPADLAEGYDAWQFTAQDEFTGARTIRLRWEQPVEGFAAGKSIEMTVPHFRPQGVDRSWGQIVLAKAEGIEIEEQEGSSGLQPIDPQNDVKTDTPITDAARAYEFVDDWKLPLKATRYELEPVKSTSIERALVRMVQTRSGKTAVQALYRLRSARQRLAVTLPAAAKFDAEPLRVNNRPATLEKGAAGTYYLPMTRQAVATPVLVELRFTLDEANDVFELPQFPEEPAVQQVYLCVYLPDERVPISSGSGWHDENRWRWQSASQGGDQRALVPMPIRSDTELLAWVRQGVPLEPSQDAFATDGKLYVFSTLRPEPTDSLRLRTTDSRRLKALTGLLILVGGLLLMRGRWCTRIIAVGALIAGLVTLAVFAPLLSHQLVSDALWGSLAVVVIGWIGWQAYRGQRPAQVVEKKVIETPVVPAADSPIRTSMIQMEERNDD